MRKLVRGLFIVNFLIEFSFCFFSRSFSAERDVIFLLRIRNREFDKSEALSFESKEEIKSSAFDDKKPVIFHIHGYIEDEKKNEHRKLSEAILEKHDVNLFFIDWGKGAKTFDYSLAKNRVYDVAGALGSFMIFLQENYKVDLSKVTCIGFSLGAHICGVAHQYLEGKKMGKVIGLDPAGPLFDINEPAYRINPDSAEYVECIHTGHTLGIRAPVCQADFFANKGSHQPGCESILGIDNVICSHYRAIWYYIEALKNPEAFYGKSCSDFKYVLSGTCDGNDGDFMGCEKNSEKKVKGIFQVSTNKESPFGRGCN